jgi:hypothetical protein
MVNFHLHNVSKTMQWIKPNPSQVNPKNVSRTLVAAVSNTRVSDTTAVYDLMYEEIQLSASFVQE